MQLPVGDKPCLADPVDSPESLGTRSAAVLIDVCTCGSIASYSKKLCCSHKWIGEIWFQGNLNYCTLGGGRIWWGARRENTDAPHVLGFRGTRAVILSGVLDSNQICSGLFTTTEEIHAMYNHSGVNITSARCEGCLEAAHLQNRWKGKRCYSTITPSDDTITVKYICQLAGESQF